MALSFSDVRAIVRKSGLSEHGLVGIPWTEISVFSFCLSFFISRRPPWRRAIMPKRTADVFDDEVASSAVEVIITRKT